jgi:hypothetical protein
MSSLAGALLSSRKAAMGDPACSRSPGVPVATTTPAAEGVQEASAEAEATVIVSSVTSLDTWLETVLMLIRDLPVGPWSASSASKKAIWPETAPTLMLMAVEAEDEEVVARERATNARKRVIWLENAQMATQVGTHTRDLVVMTMAATLGLTLEQAMLVGVTMETMLRRLKGLITGLAAVLLKVETGTLEQGLAVARTTTNERVKSEVRKVII